MSKGLKVDEDELIHYLENTEPLEMLRDIGGKEPLSVDVKLIEKLINTHGLSVGVINVLMQYVCLQNGAKITNRYIEQIASHWVHKNVNTARMAIEMCRNQHTLYTKWEKQSKIK